MLQIKSLIALLILAIYLMPGTVQLIHQHEHENECDSTEQHFCLHDNSCQICDFSFSATDEPVRELLIQDRIEDHYQDNFRENQSPESDYTLYYLLRGPPYFA